MDPAVQNTIKGSGDFCSGTELLQLCYERGSREDPSLKCGEALSLKCNVKRVALMMQIDLLRKILGEHESLK